MLPTIVGPPLKGVADFKTLENPKTENSREAKKAGSDSFGETLGAKMAPKTKEVDEKKPEPLDRQRPESEKKLEKLRATKEDGAEKKTKGNSQRENAILDFMDSFESEFGVPPTRIVEAMANLKATDQLQSPEATVDGVIGQLDLDDQDEDQARAMYMGLLAQLAQIDQNPQQLQPKALPEASPEGMFAGAAATGALIQERFSVSQEKRDALNQSLDNMNQKFWMNRPEADLSDRLTQMSLQEKLLQPQGLSVDEGILNQSQQQPVAELSDLAQGQKKEATPEEALAALVAAARAAKGRGELKELASEFEDSSLAPAPEAQEPGENVQTMNGVEASSANQAEMDFKSGQNSQSGQNLQQQQQQQEGFGQGKESGIKGEIQSKTKNIEKADFKQSLGLEGLSSSLAPLKQETLVGSAAVGGAAAGMSTPPTQAENEANVRQLMNQAQYLIKKGGGEMKVEMTPEGLGRINMKVLVQDGKVNVQMVADTREAKKTLEGSLPDLKNSLAAHKLSMDHVKIDIVSGPNTDNNTQNQMNQNNPGSRDQARQFWSNFNQNFGHPGQERSGFTDMPSLRGYPRPRTDKGIEPLQSASVNKYAAAGKGKGLNLVA